MRKRLTLSSGKNRYAQMTENRATDPKIQPIFTPMLGSK